MKFSTIAALAVFVCVTQAAFGQSYPAKTVRIIANTDPGAPADLIGRAISPPLSQALGQPFVVENRVGANGVVGVEAVTRSAPDGYTLLVTVSSPISFNPYFYAKLAYEPLRDLAPVINVGVVAACIMVSRTLPAASMKEVIELARAKPRSITWATWGPGSFSDLYRAWAENDSGVSFLEIPYKSPVQAFNAVLSGESQVGFNTAAALVNMVKAGKIRAVATVGASRYHALPDVPSFVEQGYDMDLRGWVGIFAPAGTPGAIVRKLNGEINKIIAEPKFVERFLVPSSVELRGGTPEQFAAFVKADRELAGRLVRMTAVKPQ